MEYVDKVEPVSTNIIIFSLKSIYNEDKFIELLLDNNIRLIKLGRGKIRIVTHRDYTQNQHEFTINILKNLKI